MKTLIQKDLCYSVFITALSAIARTWNQPTCLSTDDWFKHIYIHNAILLSHKKRKINAIYSNMAGPRDYHTK